jgi:glutamate-5-semialdehyde dehydrogenase
MTVEEIGLAAKAAEAKLAVLGTAVKNRALENIADALIENEDNILSANAEDVETARLGGMSLSLTDRLALTPQRIAGISDGVRKVAALGDPIGRVEAGWVRPNGLRIEKTRVPLGVIGLIFEARPNVAADAAALCLKSGNACVLRGGKEAIRSNLAIVSVMRSAVAKAGVPEDAIQILSDTSHEAARELMRLRGCLDVLIPRGGHRLIDSVVENATVPVIRTGAGNCHVYIDSQADLDMGVNIIVNAKTSRPSVCNAAETLLVHRAVAERFLPLAAKELTARRVELRGDEETRRILGDIVVPATEEDWATEYDDYILAVKVVSDLDEAIAHINRYGTMHSEAIVTDSYANGEKFMDLVDAAAVYINASTRFTDGNQFGFGAEIGISNQKLHARGPMGLDELTTIKYRIYGSGQTREA